ncbi:MAG TPA: alpha/beta hydrolase [Acidimicrobiales bacterium]|nr:alpha/beta hydrolase [Acidimicrobiales bacterium]
MSGPWRVLDGPAGALRAYTAGPASGPVLFICTELPLTAGGAPDAGRTHPSLADRLAQESEWRVVTATLRGAGGSAGDFSPAGWLEDLAFLVDHEIGPHPRYWVAGFGFGGAVGLQVVADDPRARGAACLGAPVDFSAWTADAAGFVARCRRSGVVATPGFPADPVAWAAEFDQVVPLAAARRLEDRSLLVVHGADDYQVLPASARDLAEAATGPVDLRLVPGAGHWLRADPRVVATLLGWLERQR